MAIYVLDWSSPINVDSLNRPTPAIYDLSSSVKKGAA